MEILIITLILLEIPSALGMGLIFKKMNLEFTKGIIPFYNKIILIQKYKLPSYLIIMVFIPLIRLYANYQIYNKICKENEKDFLYVIELTLFPFVYNFFLEKELKQIEPKELEEETKQEKEEPEIPKDEYIWRPKVKIKSDTIYKATRNDIQGEVNLDLKNEIINSKQIPKKKIKEGTKTCPNCGAKVPENTKICFVCGTEL